MNPSPSTIPIITASRLRRDRIIPSKLLIPGIVAAASSATQQALGRTGERTQDTVHASINPRNGVSLPTKFCPCLVRLVEQLVGHSVGTIDVITLRQQCVCCRRMRRFVCTIPDVSL